jgi:hypothetical protein
MKRSLSSIGLHSFQGIRALTQMHLCVNHVSGTFCKLCVEHYIKGPLAGPFFIFGAWQEIFEPARKQVHSKPQRRLRRDQRQEQLRRVAPKGNPAPATTIKGKGLTS